MLNLSDIALKIYEKCSPVYFNKYHFNVTQRYSITYIYISIRVKKGLSAQFLDKFAY
jgi:hypothetical protein